METKNTTQLYISVDDYIDKKAKETGRNRTSIVTELAEAIGKTQSSYYNMVSGRTKFKRESKLAIYIHINKEIPANDEILNAFFNKKKDTK